jgi:hypothetical protein
LAIGTDTAGPEYEFSVIGFAAAMRSGSVFVSGSALGEDPIIHVYDRLGHRIRSFGALYRSPNRVVNARVAMGKLVCDSGNQLVLHTPRIGVGEVRAYRTNGSLVWRTLLTGYRVSRIEDGPGGSVRASPSPNGVHSLQGMTLLPGTGLLLQLAFRSPQALSDRTPFTTLHSFLLDSRTGRLSPLGTTLPPILAAGAEEVALVFEDPVPRFEVRMLRVQ